VADWQADAVLVPEAERGGAAGHPHQRAQHGLRGRGGGRSVPRFGQGRYPPPHLSGRGVHRGGQDLGRPGHLGEGVKQLLERLTWRDAYGVAVIISNNADFGGVLAAIPAALAQRTLPRWTGARPRSATVRSCIWSSSCLTSAQLWSTRREIRWVSLDRATKTGVLRTGLQELYRRPSDGRFGARFCIRGERC
jgi:hypothetical protein